MKIESILRIMKRTNIVSFTMLEKQESKMTLQQFIIYNDDVYNDDV